MTFLKSHKMIVFILIVFLCSTQSKAFFEIGKKIFDVGSMLPYLKQQLRETRKVLRTANKQLGELKSIHRGAKNIRKYITDSYDSPYVIIMKELNAIEKEASELRKGGSDSVYTYDNLPKGLKEAYQKRKRQEDLQIQVRKQQLRIARKGNVSADYTEDVTIKQLSQDRRRLRKNSDQSHSLAESSKITNEGIGLLLDSNTENLRIQKEQLKIQSTQLIRDIKQEEQKAGARFIDEMIVKNAFSGIKK